MLYAILGIVLVLLVVAVIRAIAIKAPAKIDYTPESTPQELKIAEEKLNLKKGDKIVITGGVVTGESGNTNLIKVQDI